VLPASLDERPHMIDRRRHVSAVDARPGRHDRLVHLQRNRPSYFSCPLPGSPRAPVPRLLSSTDFRRQRLPPDPAPHLSAVTDLLRQGLPPGALCARTAPGTQAREGLAALPADAFRSPASVAFEGDAGEVLAASCAGALDTAAGWAAAGVTIERLAAAFTCPLNTPDRASVACERPAPELLSAPNAGPLTGAALRTARTPPLERLAAISTDTLPTRAAARVAAALAAGEHLAAVDAASPLGIVHAPDSTPSAHASASAPVTCHATDDPSRSSGLPHLWQAVRGAGASAVTAPCRFR